KDDFIACGYAQCKQHGYDALDAWRKVLECVWGPCLDDCSGSCGDGQCDLTKETCISCAEDCCPGTGGVGGTSGTGGTAGTGGVDGGSCLPAFCPNNGLGIPC